MRGLSIWIGLSVVLGGCSGGCHETAEWDELDEAPQAVEPPPPARGVTDEQARVEAAVLAQLHGAVASLGSRTKAQLVERLQSDGPAGALDACAVDAAQILAEVGALSVEGTGASVVSSIKLGRSSHRLRNAANAGPDWVTEWLDAHKDLPAKKAEAVSTVVAAADGAQARVLKPLAVSGPCLLCHGPKEGLASDVQEALAARYPQDQATGFKAGQLRGVIYAQANIRYLAASASDGASSATPPDDPDASEAEASSEAGSGN
jgi:hypothetical protein